MLHESCLVLARLHQEQILEAAAHKFKPRDEEYIPPYLQKQKEITLEDAVSNALVHDDPHKYLKRLYR